MRGLESGFMDVKLDKRACERHACDLPVVWCYFNQNQFHKARQLNFSEGGVCLESSLAPRPGATILIKRQYPAIEKCTSEICEGHREITLAEVRWCCEAKDTIGCHYCVGASYLTVGYP